MSDKAFHYRVAPKTLLATMTLACRLQKKNFPVLSFFHGLTATSVLLIPAITLLFFQVSLKLPWLVFTVFTGLPLFLTSAFFLNRAWSRRQAEDWGDCSITLKEAGILIATAEGNSLFFWPYVKEIREIREAKDASGSWFALVLGGSAQSLVTPVPCAAFADDTERLAFLDAVRENIEKGRTISAPKRRIG
ncbi:MAG: hypothetical protein LBJ76_05070 [Candidatus Accumulibacter sp.]|jgi:hypothetical protein|nr:hypothetical protein [Accumulibacter sp.]